MNGLVSKIEVVPVRAAFRHEALDFTAWLEQNIEALSERLGLTLTVLEREQTVGDFKVDLVCQDEDGNRVIIENQLEKTDHDHLGKVLTYLVNLGAHTAIWITTDPRSEHERVIDWLNENTGSNAAFFLVKIEAIRIGDSPYAPLFTVLAQPDSLLSEIGEKKKQFSEKELAERDYRRREFWTRLLERARNRLPMYAKRSPTTEHWLSGAAGIGGVEFNFKIFKDWAAIELYIDMNDQTRNKALFDALEQDRETIEAEFGSELDWQRLDKKRASRILKSFQSGSLSHMETWPSVQEEMIDAMIRFEKSLRPRLDKLRGTLRNL